MYWKKTSVLGEEKDALGSEKVKYFGTQFESYKVKYFGMRGCLNYIIETSLG